MSLIVQKYGGSSVATTERIKAVAARIAQRQEQGNQLLVVVSAMGDTTDDLIELCHRITSEPHGRELDMLLSTGEIVSCSLMAMALEAGGHDAVALSGSQAGIRTNAKHRHANIEHVDPARMKREIDKGNIVIVAGFQGITEEQDVTTLGRGGSDTTAVALAIALKADACEIYTDVDGVFTADPRIVENARKLDYIGYEEMLELAQLGAKVMHPRAVELGQVYGMPITVRSSFNDNPGTVINGGKNHMELLNKVSGVAHDRDVGKITILGVPDKPGVASQIFVPLAQAGISVDTIVQNIGHGGLTDMSFTITQADLDRAMRVVEGICQAVGARGVQKDDTLAKVSIVGTGMVSTPGYAATMFKTLAEAGINIEMITTSEIRITCLVKEDKMVEATRALHKAFELDKA